METLDILLIAAASLLVLILIILILRCFYFACLVKSAHEYAKIHHELDSDELEFSNSILQHTRDYVKIKWSEAVDDEEEDDLDTDVSAALTQFDKRILSRLDESDDNDV